MTNILSERRDGALLITLNKPEALNAFDFAMYDELIGILEGLRQDLDTRVVILTGAGKGFCAGHDQKNPGSRDINPDYGPLQRNKISLNCLVPLAGLMKAIPQPIIAAVNGAAAGIGYSIALCSDIILVSTAAKFVNAFHNAGTGSEMGLSYLLPRIVGLQCAAEILYTGRAVSAEEAVRIGLAQRALAPDQLLDAAFALAADISANTPLGIWLTKQNLWLNQSAGSLDAAIELEARAIHLSQASADLTERRKAALEKRRPQFKNT
jgi:enoyl-CoA hydratase